MRQRGPEATLFRSLLQNVRDGTVDYERDWKLIASRDLSLLPEEEKNEFNETAIKICAANKDLKPFNLRKLKALETPIAYIEAVNDPPGIGKSLSANRAGGLPQNTVLAEGSRVMLICNLFTESGLYNGARGTVVRILYRPDSHPPDLPTCVLVRFDHYKGGNFEEHEFGENVVPICPRTTEFFAYNTKCSRTMIPLISSYAMSIHRVQGMTFSNKVIINLGEKEFSIGLTYTALSRAKQLDGIAFDPTPTWKRFSSFCKRVEFQNRLKEEKRLENFAEETAKAWEARKQAGNDSLDDEFFLDINLDNTQFQLQGSIPGSDEDLSNLVPMQKLAGNDSIEDEFFLNVDLDNPQSHHQGSIPGSDEDLMDIVPMQVEDEFLSADDEEFHSAEENDPITKHWN